MTIKRKIQGNSQATPKAISTTQLGMEFIPARLAVGIRTWLAFISIHGMVAGVDCACRSNFVLVFCGFPLFNRKFLVAPSTFCWNTFAAGSEVALIVRQIGLDITMFCMCALGAIADQRCFAGGTTLLLLGPSWTGPLLLGPCWTGPVKEDTLKDRKELSM